MSLLTQGLNYRSACDVLVMERLFIIYYNVEYNSSAVQCSHLGFYGRHLYIFYILVFCCCIIIILDVSCLLFL